MLLQDYRNGFTMSSREKCHYDCRWRSEVANAQSLYKACAWTSRANDETDPAVCSVRSGAFARRDMTPHAFTVT